MQFDFATLPTRLPARSPAPASLAFEARIADTENPHPAALRGLTIDLDRAFTVAVAGLPSCSRQAIVGSETAAIRHACPGSLVGAGRAAVSVADSPGEDTSTRLTIVNGGERDDIVTLFARSDSATGEPTFTIRIQLHRVSRGRYATRTAMRVPRLLDGRGALRSLRLRLDRRYAADGKRRSLVSARCIDGYLHSRIVRAEFVAEQATPQTHTTLKGTLVRTCTPTP